jgi:hypothetical protein
MPNTYTLLETITVGAAGASSVTFNSIPQTGYTDLVMKMSARLDVNDVQVKMYFNADSTAANYSWRRLYGDGATAVSDSGTNLINGSANGANMTASTFGNAEFYIPNYTSSNKKSSSADHITETNGTTAYATLAASLWQGTAAISSITLLPNTTGNFVQHSTFSLYGVSALGVTPTKAPKATGGSIIQTDGTYWYHAFLSSGTFTPATALSCDVLVVAGGGGSSTQFTGGAGAGGVCYQTSRGVTSSVTITVGGGGAGAANNSFQGGQGSNSVFDTITALGGGGGASVNVSGGAGVAGGSGSGAGFNSTSGGAATQGNSGGATGYGNAGGAGLNSGNQPSGGGGGAGAAGAAGAGSAGGAGGIGLNTWSSWASATGTGQSGYYAGGGGGNIATPGTYGAGGLGGGGAAILTNGTPGTANTGGGAGGGGNPGAGAAGGSGIVIIRYLA